MSNQSSELYCCYAHAPKACDDLLAQELETCGATDIKRQPSGVSFNADIGTIYRACLWSRIASRILLELKSWELEESDALYKGALAINWDAHFTPDNTLAIDCTLLKAVITHSKYAAQVTKDAVVDYFRTHFQRRPSIDRQNPDIRLHLHVEGRQARLYLNVSGGSLHKRGYRSSTTHQAPLKENVAAAMLMRAGFRSDTTEQFEALVDPMCGSGTLLIEAALMAGDHAPGLLHAQSFGFLHWKGHNPSLWDTELQEAQRRARAARDNMPTICGYDVDKRAIHTARAHVKNAGLERVIYLAVHDSLAKSAPPKLPALGDTQRSALLITNTPYGKRLKGALPLDQLYRKFGIALKRHYPGWNASILLQEQELGHNLGLRASRFNTLYNGAMRCTVLHIEIAADAAARADAPLPPRKLSEGAQMLQNRLQKNIQRLNKWAHRHNITCYRLYDADLPEYVVAIDVYEGRFAHVQEYAPPKSVDPAKARKRLEDVRIVVPMVLDLPAEQVYFKTRQRQKGSNQYEQLAREKQFETVREGGLTFQVNFKDYLDTGLFLDHRPVRELIRNNSRNKRLLNLFAYTGSASVYAAAGKARFTMSVDASVTYCRWARENFEHNGFSKQQHHILRSDVLEFLDTADRDKPFELIFCDPPSFSNSKEREASFDIQRDHVKLIRLCSELLAAQGVLIFSCNLRRFKLDRKELADFHVRDISSRSIPEDFKRRSNIHHCFLIAKSAEALQAFQL